ncbi:hypothetical protein EV360DRAFT_76811 [Lentinula raphanica]|nr:hypothetical protein EV360DRAFT_76811 [Lentinula raphanica]
MSLQRNSDNNNPDPSGSQNLHFGDFTGSSENQPAPVGAPQPAGAPAFNNATGPGFSGPFGGGSHPGFFTNPPQNFGSMAGGSSATSAHSPAGQVMNPQFQVPSIHHAQPPFPHQPTFAPYGFSTPMMPIPGMVSTPNPQPLRITIGNIIAHSENCPTCMNYIAHLAMANDFNEAIAQRDSIIRSSGASSSSSIPSSCNHEPLISSLQEQLASVTRIHEVERQTLNDRITALELERSELRACIDEDETRIKRIVRNGDAVDDERHYWKNKYYDLVEGVEPTQSRANSPENQPKSSDKDDAMDPIPPREEPPTTASTSEVSTSVKLPKPTVPSKASPHSGEKRKRNESTGTPSRRDVVPYDDLYPRDRLNPSYKPGEVETDSDDLSEPDPHPNRLKGKMRALQNKTNKEVKRKWHEEDVRRAKAEGRPIPIKKSKSSKNREWDALREGPSKLPFKPPTTVEEYERICQALRDSDNFQPPRLMWKTVNGMRRLSHSARMTPLSRRTELENVLATFSIIPRWYKNLMELQGKKVPSMTTVGGNTPSASNAPGTSASHSRQDPLVIESIGSGPSTMVSSGPPTRAARYARGDLVPRNPTVRENRTWFGLTESSALEQWALAILSHSPEERLPGMRVEVVNDTARTNTRSIRGMLAVFQLIPNAMGTHVIHEGDANLWVHLMLCELALHPTRYEGMLQVVGLEPNPIYQPGPLPEFPIESPIQLERICRDLANRGYTVAHLQDMALYLLWWLNDVAHCIPHLWDRLQQQFSHVVRSVLAQYVFNGVPRTTNEIEQYVYPDGSRSDNIDNAGRFADYSVVLTHTRSIVDALGQSAFSTTVPSSSTVESSAPPPSNSTTTEVPSGAVGPDITDPPEPIDWDAQFTSDGDPRLDYGDDGMDMAGNSGTSHT